MLPPPCLPPLGFGGQDPAPWPSALSPSQRKWGLVKPAWLSAEKWLLVLKYTVQEAIRAAVWPCMVGTEGQVPGRALGLPQHPQSWERGGSRSRGAAPSPASSVPAPLPGAPLTAFERGHCYEPYIQNGNFTTSDPTYNLGTTVEFTCDPGHSLEQGPAVIECVNMRDPYWNDTEPLCRGE